MSERLIVVATDPGHVDTIAAMADQSAVLDCQIYRSDGDALRHSVHLLVGADDRQAVLDRLQGILGGSAGWRITILPVEATIPLQAEEEVSRRPDSKSPAGESREELYSDVSRNARLDSSFLVFVTLSTVAAAIGLIENNVAVLIGAMLIAPLLGPNLAFCLGVALGDRALMGRAMGTNAVGVMLTLAICVFIGMLWPIDLGSAELMARTDVGFDGMALALASGAAAALSLTTGISATLIGVMVAVALLPPAATIGLMAGVGRWDLALGAALLLAVNIVCVNLSAQVVFLARGVTPRTWYEKETARRATLVNASIWLTLLASLTGLLLLRAPAV